MLATSFLGDFVRWVAHSSGGFGGSNILLFKTKAKREVSVVAWRYFLQGLEFGGGKLELLVKWGWIVGVHCSQLSNATIYCICLIIHGVLSSPTKAS